LTGICTGASGAEGSRSANSGLVGGSGSTGTSRVVIFCITGVDESPATSPRADPGFTAEVSNMWASVEAASAAASRLQADGRAEDGCIFL